MRVNSLFCLINNLVLNFVGIPQPLTPLIDFRSLALSDVVGYSIPDLEKSIELLYTELISTLKEF
jgi:hypothetical protein